ncbi:MAG: UbiX family flavin prenyltransferase [Fibrobacterales bacterium]
MRDNGTILVGITGASGAIYARRLIYHLMSLNHSVELVISSNGAKVIDFEKERWIKEQGLKEHAIDNMFSAPASGTANIAAMVILPCSVGTIGNIAGGTSNNLLVRAADVCLKERKPLIVCPREMPFNTIHLDNMKKIMTAGGIIAPTSPHFYFHPESIEEVVDTVVAKVLDLLELPHTVFPAWGSE